MAKKSKTQKAKASAARAARKLEREREQAQLSSQAADNSVDNADDSAEIAEALKKDAQSNSGLKSVSKRADSKQGEASKNSSKKADIKKTDSKKQPSKADKKSDQPKKKHFQFLRDVRAELKRVTWPTKQDVLQWSVVVVAALIFFGAFVAILDNLVITPALVGVSSIEVQSDSSKNESNPIAVASVASDDSTAASSSSATDEAALNDELASTNDSSAVDNPDATAAQPASSEGSEG